MFNITMSKCFNISMNGNLSQKPTHANQEDGVKYFDIKMHVVMVPAYCHGS